MILYKRGQKYWNFEDDGVVYTPSKFTINTISNDFYIVYENNLKSKKYNVSEVTLTDVVGGGSFTFANANLFMQKLEELNCPCFQKDQTTINNPPINPTDFLSTNIANYTDATLPIAETDELFVIQGGEVKKVNKRDIIGCKLNTNNNVTGNYSIDYNFDTFDLKLTGNTTLSETNLPVIGFTKTITMYISGNFSITYPPGWTNNIIGSYDGSKLNQFVIEYRSNGTYFLIINQPD